MQDVTASRSIAAGIISGIQLIGSGVAIFFGKGFLKESNREIPALSEFVVSSSIWLLPLILGSVITLLTVAKKKNDIRLLWLAKAISIITIAFVIIGLIQPMLFTVPRLD